MITSSIVPRSVMFRSSAFCPMSLQHPGDAQILVDVGPMNAHRHDLVVRPLRCRCALEPRVPIERRRDLAAIHERDDKLARRELDGARFQIADFKLHRRRPLTRLRFAQATSPARGEGRITPANYRACAPGISNVFPRSIASGRAMRGRVAWGMITSSIQARSALSIISPPNVAAQRP